MLRAAFEEQKLKAYELNHGAAQYAILKHEVETTRDLYETLQRKLKEAGISAGLAWAASDWWMQRRCRRSQLNRGCRWYWDWGWARA